MLREEILNEPTRGLQDEIRRDLIKFINNQGNGKYLRLAKQLASNIGVGNTIVIETEDLIRYNYDLAYQIFEHYYKYEKIVNDTFTQLMFQLLKDQYQTENINLHRENSKQKYYIAFTSGLGGSNQSDIGVRDLKCSKIGKLSCLIGTITRSTQVIPQMVIGVFKCQVCKMLSRPIEQQFKYTIPKKCLNGNCDSNSWQPQMSLSQLADFQLIRVQQDSKSIPAGGMPRSINVIVRNHNADKAQPGDICKFVGYLCVSPQISSMLKPGERTVLTTRNMDTRGNAMQMEGVKGVTGMRQLNYKLVYIANNVIIQNKQYHDVEMYDQQEQQNLQRQDNMGEYQNQQRKRVFHESKIYDRIFESCNSSELQELKEMKDNPHLFQDLAESLFPGIFGHSEIKKAILLQLFGGVHKTTKNKIKIRGDINILLVGDPSTAKSQFLKAVNKFVPRSVYTNGKTTSAAGLTASVIRDEYGNVSIEAGALMLADNGVCCIDQFDKMNLSDMTAIHEAMEQQTISIAKAGVHATLNARTSVLAAANPIFGRYDKSKNLQKNLNISPPIMSRFDLCFVICDQASTQSDTELCNFIIKMHRQRQTSLLQKYNYKSLKFYISIAKRLKPMISKNAALKLRDFYIKIRQTAKETGSTYTATVRQLESIIRLSQAFARLNLNLQITEQYVDEAYKLILNSITRLKKADISLETEQQQGQKQNKQTINKKIEQQVKKKNQKKDNKLITLSSEVYNQIQSNIIKIFVKSKEGSNKNKHSSMIDEDDSIILTQENVINYVISLQFEKDTIQTEEQEKNYRKIIRAVIKKMIKDERKLMVQEEDVDESKRKLKLHPNLIIQ